MSLNETNIPLKPIVSPELTATDFAFNFKNMVDNIDANFKILANHDFIKGDRGDSVKVIETSIHDENGELNEWGNLIKQCIEDNVEANLRENVVIAGEPYNVFDNLAFDPENPDKSKLHLIYNISDYEKDVPVGSLPYVFLDGRFANINIGKATDYELSKYSDLSDTSCILVYEKDGFKILENAFPTVYYEKHIGLCWKINGGKTGLPIQGIPGKDGLNAPVYIVKAEQIDTSLDFKVTHVYEAHDSYIEIDKFENVEQLYNSAAVVLIPCIRNNYEEESVQDAAFYFGKIYKDDKTDEIRVYCTTDTRINLGVFELDVINAMKRISLASSTGIGQMRGLFVPIDDMRQPDKTTGELMGSDEPQHAHLISSSSILNIPDYSKDPKTDLLITPIKDVNIDMGDDGVLEVDKYLYLKVKDDSNNIFAVTSDGTSVNNLKSKILKYKLDYKVLPKTSDSFKILTTTDKTGSRYFGRCLKTDGSIIDLNEENVIYNENESTDHFDSMPSSFKDLLDQTNDSNLSIKGIYRWVLCDTKDIFDIDELNTSEEKYTFDEAFKVIYTNTITPSSDSIFLWFNALESKAIKNDKILIPGWDNDYDTHKIFEFLKFVPIYNKSKKFIPDYDTAINLNYNVNITGNTIEDSSKSLTVNGDINCENISVKNIIPLGTIENVNTTNNIFGDFELHTGKSTNGYSFNVNTSGDAIGKSLNVSNVYSNDINTNTITTDNIKANNFKELNFSNKNSSFNIKSNKSTNKFDININDFTNLKLRSGLISKTDSDGNEKGNFLPDIPTIQSNISAHFSSGAPIVLSNKLNIDADLYLKYADKCLENSYGEGEDTGNYHFNAGSGVSEFRNIERPSFESAKNFNIHRLIAFNKYKSKLNISEDKDAITYNSIGYSSVTNNDEKFAMEVNSTNESNELVLNTLLFDTIGNVNSEVSSGAITDSTQLEYITNNVIQDLIIPRDIFKKEPEPEEPEPEEPIIPEKPTRNVDLRFMFGKNFNPYVKGSSKSTLCLLVSEAGKPKYLVEYYDIEDHELSGKLQYTTYKTGIGDSKDIKIDGENHRHIPNNTIEIGDAEANNVNEISEMEWEGDGLTYYNEETGDRYTAFSIEYEQFKINYTIYSDIIENEDFIDFDSVKNVSKLSEALEISNNTPPQDEEELPPTITNEMIYKMSAEDLVISFDNNIMCQIGINGKILNGSCPVLYNSSKMILSVYCEYIPNPDDTSLNELYYIGKSEEYLFDYTTDNTNDKNFSWRGYTKDGKKHLDNFYEYDWRYNTYTIRPNNIVIPGEKIADLYNALSIPSDENVKIPKLRIIVVPQFYLFVKGQHNKTLINGIRATCPRIIPETYTFINNSRSNANNILYRIRYFGSDMSRIQAGDSLKISEDFTNYGLELTKDNKAPLGNIKCTLNISYKSSDENSESTLRSTTICNDGIVFNVDNYIFGLGSIKNENQMKPALVWFNYDKDKNYNDIISEGTGYGDVTLDKYNNYTNSITLEELFNKLSNINS